MVWDAVICVAGLVPLRSGDVCVLGTDMQRGNGRTLHIRAEYIGQYMFFCFCSGIVLLFSFIWECFIPNSVAYSCCIHETWHGQVAFIFNVYHINRPLIALVVFFRHYVTFDWERLVMHNRGVTG